MVTRTPVEALNAVNPPREQAMVSRIVAAGAPLFVQIGQAHVGRVEAELRKRGVKVLGLDSSDDFLAMVSRANPPRQQPVPVAPSGVQNQGAGGPLVGANPP